MADLQQDSDVEATPALRAGDGEQPFDKPLVAAGYAPDMLELVRQTCLYVATILGDLFEQHVTIVGGLVPYLLIKQEEITEAGDRHIGTRDLDLGFAVTVLDEERYEVIAERLRRASFRPDVNENDRMTRQRWRVDLDGGRKVTVDFLIPPVEGEDAGSPFSLERDLAALVTPGIDLAFRDREVMVLEGYTILGEHARRPIPVCGPAAFVILKAIAFRRRGERKDVYDLFYVLRHYGEGVGDVVARMRPLLDSPVAREALAYLRDDFERSDSIGPQRIVQFLQPEDPDALSADASAFVRALLDGVAGGAT